MRTSAYSFLTLISFVSVVSAGVIGACGGSVQVDSGATGSSGVGVGVGGSGGAPMSVVAVGTTVGDVSANVSASVTTDGVGSSSTGGLDACDMACEKAKGCGLDLCSQFGIDCANPSPQFACPEKCIAGASCADIQALAMMKFGTPLGLCLIGCQGMGPGSAAVSGSSGTGGLMACGQCLGQQCGAALQACATDAGPNSTHCAKWLQCETQCYQGNPNPACFDACDAATPSAAPKYDAVYACSCASCGAECGASDPCSHIGASSAVSSGNGSAASSSVTSTGSGANSSAASSAVASSSGSGGTTQQCSQCAVQQCGGALQACAFDPTCFKWLQCAQGCQNDVACTKACDMTYAGVAGKYKPIYACECNSCIGECAAPVDPCSH